MINMPIREFLLSSIFTCVTMMYAVDSIAFHERVRWIALGEEMRDRAGIEIDRYNSSLRITTMAEVVYETKNGMKINSIIAGAANMNGFVSLENGGLEEDHATIRYITENGTQDEFFVFFESYKIEPFNINDNSIKNGNVAVVMNGIRNWTNEILRGTLQTS